MKTEYTSLEPSVLTIASSAMASQRGRHIFLNERHAAVVTKTNATISELDQTIHIDSWERTAPFPYELARSAPDTSFDERGNVGGKPGYQWYTKAKRLARTFKRPSLSGNVATKSSIEDSDKTSPNMACRVKFIDSTACIGRSKESTT